jgi:predicted peptidase
MKSLSIAALLGVLLMAQSGDLISVDPGKQLPQSVKLRIDDDGGRRDITIRYMLFVPQDYKPDGKPWPLMLFLHGLGECSNDDISRVKIHGPPSFADSRPDFPFVVVTPQLPPPPGYDPESPTPLKQDELLALVSPAWKAKELIQLLNHVQTNLNIDPTRVYATGLSMGGYGTWRLVAEYPERFAAALPICSGGKPCEMARSLSRVPIWAFHGALDPVVPLSESQEMVDAVRGAGGNVRFTVYPDVAHDSWKRAYDNPEVYDWLLSHRGPLKGQRVARIED